VIVDALRYEDASKIVAGKILPYVLSMPRRCPCGQAWLVLLSESLALEVEVGSAGQTHLKLLQESMRKGCPDHNGTIHLRTDGETVWTP
jgi:hypothetical protein